MQIITVTYNRYNPDNWAYKNNYEFNTKKEADAKVDDIISYLREADFPYDEVNVVDFRNDKVPIHKLLRKTEVTIYVYTH